jgi:hypothetical protein
MGLIFVDRSTNSLPKTTKKQDKTGTVDTKSAQQSSVIVRRYAGFTQVYVPPKKRESKLAEFAFK